MIDEPKIYTVESVTNGHPDKICDQISDAILDACLEQDPKSRVAMETFGGHNLILVGGEITSKAQVDFKAIAGEVYRKIGYNDPTKFIANVVCQSPDISMGVDTGGAGDQGIMYGYATNETAEFLPYGLTLAHKLVYGLESLRREDELTFLKPDGKSQVTMENKCLKTILISTQHQEGISQDKIRHSLIEKLIKPLVSDLAGVEVLVNPTGNFVLGGFAADTGLTGRKIMVDTYGGLAPHGGGAFSGKDPTKVDRSAAYMARFVAKNIVANGLAQKCLVSVAYAIGRAQPVMVEALNEKGESLAEIVNKNFDFRPQAIIERLNLRRPIYQQTAAYGHFGKASLPWEEIIKL
ncbi:MAG: methionine adenosyltransferase [Candidatus Gribaldobacteria bacterium]|nr:methionine adenosyltransferase [Candidatus Gribaldobacteria bacterium]